MPSPRSPPVGEWFVMPSIESRMGGAIPTTERAEGRCQTALGLNWFRLSRCLVNRRRTMAIARGGIHTSMAGLPPGGDQDIRPAAVGAWYGVGVCSRDGRGIHEPSGPLH